MCGAIGGKVPFLCCSVYPCHVLVAPDDCCVLRPHGIRGFRGVNVVPRAVQFRSSAPRFSLCRCQPCCAKRTSDLPSSQLVFPHHRHRTRNEADLFTAPLGMTVDKHMDRRTMDTGPVFPLFFIFFSCTVSTSIFWEYCTSTSFAHIMTLSVSNTDIYRFPFSLCFSSLSLLPVFFSRGM
ncbi:hypothetical protein EV401DRAFT_163512 [Pisolithus croceorrhizus]|nr:hypothetical protein EV401DRAFT_163512 [Pisolithus croceorrhizus]